jgi:hypothetical protein
LPDDELTALHESGHSVAARALRRRVTLVTIEPGERWAGCSWSVAKPVRARIPSPDAPFAAWPAAFQVQLAHDVIVSLAGEISAAMFAPRAAGRALDPPGAPEVAGRLAAAAPEATEQERQRAAEGVSADNITDAERVDHLVYVGFANDWQRGLAWRAWLEAETAELLRANEDAVRRLAALLMARGVVGEQAAAAALKGVAR